MGAWTKEQALDELKMLVEWAENLASGQRYSADHTRWLARSQRLLIDVFGERSLYVGGFARISWTHSGFLSEANQYAIDEANQGAYVRDLEKAKGFLLAARDELERSDLLAVYRGRNRVPEASLLMKVINAAEQKLRKTLRAAPSKEIEVQNAFENLLIGAEVAYLREPPGIEYSSKTYIPDFVIESADLVVEIKLCARTGREKEIIAEINDDILAYRTKYANLLFVVYDVGQIRDVDRFASFASDAVMVRVVKH